MWTHLQYSYGIAEYMCTSIRVCVVPCAVQRKSMVLLAMCLFIRNKAMVLLGMFICTCTLHAQYVMNIHGSTGYVQCTYEYFQYVYIHCTLYSRVSEPEPYLAGAGAVTLARVRLRLHLKYLFNNLRKLHGT